MSKTTKKKKNPVGRPSKYKPEYCEQIQRWAANGETSVYWAARLDVSKQTIYDWCKDHPEFLDAFSRAMAKAELWWAKKGQDCLEAKSFQGGTHKFLMASMFKGDYVERKEVQAEVTTKEFKLSYKDDKDED